MKNANALEIVINATRVSPDKVAECYDFILNAKLEVVACGYVESLSRGAVRLIQHFDTELQGVLFELNHVRIDPRVDNTEILANFANKLESIGVEINNRPRANMMAICFKPLGELSSIVRFYLNAEGHPVFLSTTAKLRLVQPQAG